jgi:transcriptional regulator
VLGADRETAAEAMDSTASNVDNLHQRAREKIDDARRAVDELDRLQPDG